MKLPKMKCDRCGKCCGIIACTVAEFEAIGAYIEKHKITPVAQGTDCPFLHMDGPVSSCIIYPVRPYICKLFGHTHTLRCANGHNKNISNGELARLNDQFMSVNAACLHEFCHTSEEIEVMITKMIGEAS